MKRIFMKPDPHAAIETRYKGYRMRSRGEARWAVYFDSLGIYWDYEVEGFDLTKASVVGATELGAYLPDFWLPQVKMWAEVKAGEFSPLEVRKCDALAKLTGHSCLMLDGLPELRPFWARRPEYGDASGPEEADYIVDDALLFENRFFGFTGFERGDDPRSMAHMFSRNAKKAIEESRSARFEHGEVPVVTRRIQ